MQRLSKVYLAQCEEHSNALEFHSMAIEFDFVTSLLHPGPSVADFALGVRMLISSSKGHCAYKGGSNCSVHVLLGSLVASAAAIDFVIATTFVPFADYLCLQLALDTRQVLHYQVPPTRLQCV
jgi:hypothetical protein